MQDVGVALNFVLNAVTGARDEDSRTRAIELGLTPGHYAYSFTKGGKKPGMEATRYGGGKQASPGGEDTEAARCGGGKQAPPGRQEASPDASGLGQSDRTAIMDVA